MYTMNPWIGFLRKTNVEKITIILLKIYISTRKVCLFVCFSHFLPLKRLGGLGSHVKVAMV